MLTDDQWVAWESIVEGARAALTASVMTAEQTERTRLLLLVDAELQRLEHVKSLAQLAANELPCYCDNTRRCVKHRLSEALGKADEPVELG